MPGKRPRGQFPTVNCPKTVIDHVSTANKVKNLPETRDTRIWVTVKLDGINFRAMCDTGASASFISKETADTLQAKGVTRLHENVSRICLADGRIVEALGHMVIPTCLNNRTLQKDFLIMPDTGYSVILGIDILAAFDAMVHVRQRKVVFTQSNDSNYHDTHLNTVANVTNEDKLQKFLDEEIPRFKNVKGRTTEVEHVIRLKPGAVPVKQRYYPCNPRKQEIINAEIDRMISEDVIEPSHSPWSSPIVVVPKKNKEMRLCIDFRKVNALSIKDSYPLPYISTILDKLHNSKFFSTLDLKHGYWQIPLSKDSRPITAFTIPGKGLYQFKTLPFGAHSAPATFQRYLDSIIGPELQDIALVYLDDIIVLGKTFDEHLTNLRNIFRKLQKAGLQLQMEKCQFAQKSIKYLGHLVTDTGIKTDPEKVEAINNVPPPKTTKEVRSFLGMTSWYRRFVPNFAQITTPLVKLTKKSQKWCWEKEQEEAFQAVKAALVSSPVLTCPDFTRPFQLHTDASNAGLGVVLIQLEGTQERVVAYASRTLSKAESNYSTTEKECLAVVWGIKKFRYYLEGYKFLVITDHQCLRWLNELKNPSGRLARWAVDLQQFDFEVKYRSGQMNNLADSLSRAPLPRQSTEEQLCTVFQNISCPWYNTKVKQLTENPENDTDYVIHEGMLYRKFPDNSLDEKEHALKLCIPKSERSSILREIHDIPEAGHLGITKSMARAARYYYWPGMFRNIQQYIRKCTSCQRHKFNQQKPMGKMLHSPINGPWEQISIDLLGPFPRSMKGHTYLLIMQDKFTKWIECQPLRKATSSTVIQALQDKVIYRFGTPRIITADNGPQFISKQFKDATEALGSKIRFNAPYAPQANSVERVNKVIGPMIAQYIEKNHREWDQFINHFSFAINTAKHDSTGFSPSFLNFGREIPPPQAVFRLMQAKLEPVEYTPQELTANLDKLNDIYTIVRRNLMEAYQRQRHHYNLRHRPHRFHIGDQVYKKEFPLSNAAKQFSAKLAPKYSGPFTIKKFHSPVIVQLQIPGHRGGEKVHVKYLKVAMDNAQPPQPSGCANHEP